MPLPVRPKPKVSPMLAALVPTEPSPPTAASITISAAIETIASKRSLSDATRASYCDRLCRLWKIHKAWNMISSENQGEDLVQVVNGISLRIPLPEDASVEFCKDAALMIKLVDALFPVRSSRRLMLSALRSVAQDVVGDVILVGRYTAAVHATPLTPALVAS